MNTSAEYLHPTDEDLLSAVGSHAYTVGPVVDTDLAVLQFDHANALVSLVAARETYRVNGSSLMAFAAHAALVHRDAIGRDGMSREVLLCGLELLGLNNEVATMRIDKKSMVQCRIPSYLRRMFASEGLDTNILVP